jgi:hypothetical protein
LKLLGSLDRSGWMSLAAAFCLAPVLAPVLALVLPLALPLTLAGPARASAALEERKLPMRFSWVECQPDCGGWVSAIGIVTSDSPKDFDEFARGRQLHGATVVLDSSGGSVNDAIALGRRWRGLGLFTTVGISVTTHGAQGERASVMPDAYCESMCVFLLLSGKTRYVPEEAHIRVHQIWMGDRADDAKAATYSAQDLMIVERDVGRLAKYTYDMGGTGDLLSLSLNVPPWEDLHRLSAAELKLTNLVTTDRVAAVLPLLTDDAKTPDVTTPVAQLSAKPMQDRFVSSAAPVETSDQLDKSTKSAKAKTAEAKTAEAKTAEKKSGETKTAEARTVEARTAEATPPGGGSAK